MLKDREREKERAKKPIKEKKVTRTEATQTKNYTKRGAFTALDSDDEEDEERKPKSDKDFPALSPNVTLRTHQQHFRSYASVAQPEVVAEEILKHDPVEIKMAITTEEKKMPVIMRIGQPFPKMRSWADMMDDSDEDEEEE